jgi:integrase
MAATKAAKRALVAANVPGSLHGLRHAHATALLQARVNPRAVQQRLGHGNVSTTLATYAHAMPGDDEAAAAAIAAAIEGKSA